MKTLKVSSDCHIKHADLSNGGRSSHLKCSVRKGFLRNFRKFTRLQACNFTKKRFSSAGVYLWILWNSEEHLFLQNTSGGCFCSIHVFMKLSWVTDFFQGIFPSNQNSHFHKTSGWLLPFLDVISLFLLFLQKSAHGFSYNIFRKPLSGCFHLLHR